MPLFGREAELKALAELVDGPEDGSGVLLRGEVGIGKSALVAEAVSAAAVAGLRVLTTTGVEAEQNLPYAGLHQLLYPVRAGVDALPAPQGDALRSALGLAEGAEPSTFLVGLATLTLLAEAAAVRPLLVVAEDVHWLDRASADVLAFVARRIESEPIVMVATLRYGERSPVQDAGLTPMPVDRLSDEVAAELLDAIAPDLTSAVRARLLEEAAGNPLALTELPAALGHRGGSDPVPSPSDRLDRLGPRLPLSQGGPGPVPSPGDRLDRLGPVPSPSQAGLGPVLPLGQGGLGPVPSPSDRLGGLGPVLPLSERLEQAFTARVATLPVTTRTALLVAALNQSDSVSETLAAAGVILGSAAEPEILAPAAEVRLIELTIDTVTFRHPLMRSAIAAASTLAVRRQAHLALAETLHEQPDRRAWHRAAATAGADEGVAAELDCAADRARHRGGVAAAIAALEQAARLSEGQDRKALRLLRAAELAVESGSHATAERLVREAQTLELSPRRRATAAWLLSGFEDGVREDVSRVSELADLAASVAADGEVEPAVRILWGAAMRCFWSEPGPAARRALLGVADRLPVPADDPSMVAVAAYVAPFERGGFTLERLRELAGVAGAAPETDRYLGSAALQVGAFDLAARFSAAAAPGLRAEGRLGLLARALAVQAWSRTRLGDLAAAVPVGAEAAKLAQETGQPFMYGLATAVQAEIAALRGDHGQARTLADEAERVALPAGARPVLATVQLARGLAALSEARFDDAFAALSRILDPADPAYQLALRAYFLAELTEAAVRAGRTDTMRDILHGLEPLAASTPSPALHIGLRYARAVLAPNEEAEELFTAALRADLTGWPAERGRLQLAFGEWLRRQRRAAESRTHLRTARETFDALGMVAWGERARGELRSAGESSPNRDPDARERLTPHELNIAQLAADGLTNREIGQRLYLSHRTVGTHLHRIFPKLGVSSRADLSRMLKTLEERSSR